MHSFQEYLTNGQGWLFLPAAVLLGALHGMEPGHSKTMMASFIISVRGTVSQAVLLGLSAAFSHTLVIWVLAAIGLHFSGKLDVEKLEPYFQLATGLIVVGMAFWMFNRIRRQQGGGCGHDHSHDHDHDHPHDHAHEDHHEDEHEHGHAHPPAQALVAEEYADDHEREHAEELKKRFAGQHVTTQQVILFGLTGGLMPCPAAFAVLLVCLQIKQFALGFAVVLAFSLGLAITLVSVGAIAAMSLRAASKRFSGFGEWARKLPYASVGLMATIGLIVAIMGLRGILR